MISRHLTAALIVLLVTVAPAGAQEAPLRGDLARLQGKWAAMTILPDGTKIKSVIEFRGDHVLGTTGDDPKPTMDYRIVLNETANPKTLDMVEGKAINLPPDSLLAKIEPPDMYGIYELDGDTLRLAARLLNKNRPTGFARARDVSISVYNRGSVPREVTMVEPEKPAMRKSQAPKLEGDLAALQGTWTSGEGQFYGHGKETMTVQGDSLVVVAHGARGVEMRFQSRIRLDERASPKAIDFVEVKGGGRAQPDAHGIYELDGDRLTLHRSGQGYRRSSVFENGSEAGRVATWTRGSVLVEGRPMAKGTAGSRDTGGSRDGIFRGATVVKFSPRNVVFLTADGRQVQATVIGAVGFDLEGRHVGRGDELLKPGNVVDVTIGPVPGSKVGLQKIEQFRLVRVGDGAPAPKAKRQPRPVAAPPAPAPEAEGPGIEYRGAVIVEVRTKKIVLSADGKTLEIEPTDRKTRAFDLNGRQLSMMTQAWVIKKGNVVDVILNPARPKKGALPTIREIHLVQGTLRDVPRYLDETPGNRR